jgi:hypothetical protein
MELSEYIYTNVTQPDVIFEGMTVSEFKDWVALDEYGNIAVEKVRDKTKQVLFKILESIERYDLCSVLQKEF